MTAKNKERLLVSASIVLGITFLTFIITTIFESKKNACRELNKTELIDIAMKKHVVNICYEEKLFKECILKGGADDLQKICYGEKWDRKSDDVKCSLSLESLKEEAPHCFTGQRSDTCYGVVTHFDFDKKETVKREMVIYKYSPFTYSYDFLSYNNGKKFYYISTGLDYDPDDNDYVLSSCGTAKCYGCWL
jgi:hypothetical protein